MPRLATFSIRKAKAANGLLLPLLQTCRHLPAASRELRWLREHVYKTVLPESAACKNVRRSSKIGTAQAAHLKTLCVARGRGVPLQYLLGTEFFGSIELACRPGVLIPRPETADLVLQLAHRLQAEFGRRSSHAPLRVLDLCTGSGCMSLLLHTQLQATLPGPRAPTSTLGIDVSARAVRLARRNRARLGLVVRDSQGDLHSPITFEIADIFNSSSSTSSAAVAATLQQKNHSSSSSSPSPFPPPSLAARLAQRASWQHWDIVIANPPYISQREYRTTAVERSVRRFEPRAALVPKPLAAAPSQDGKEKGKDSEDADADVFYPRIVEVAEQVRARVVLMEVGGPEQASRVQRMVLSGGKWDRVEVWHDAIMASTADAITHGQRARAVVCFKVPAAGDRDQEQTVV